MRIQPTISFFNTNVEVLRWIQSKIGGSITSRINKHPDSKNVKKIYKLSITGMSDVYKVLKAIRNKLIVKRKQADLVIEYCKSRMSHKRPLKAPYTPFELKLFSQVRELNAQGKGALSRRKNSGV